MEQIAPVLFALTMRADRDKKKAIDPSDPNDGKGSMQNLIHRFKEAAEKKNK